MTESIRMLFDPLVRGEFAGLFLFALLLCSLLTVSIRVSRLQKKHQGELQQLEKRLNLIASGSMGMGKKLLELESRLQTYVDSQALATESDSQFSYTKALKLIEDGVDHSLVTLNSGLSDSEVALMQLLHNTRDNHAKTGVASM